MNKRNRVLLDLDGLTILFIYLKLTGHVQWGWWLVILPTAISVCLQLWSD